GARKVTFVIPAKAGIQCIPKSWIPARVSYRRLGRNDAVTCKELLEKTSKAAPGDHVRYVHCSYRRRCSRRENQDRHSPGEPQLSFSFRRRRQGILPRG